MRCCLTQPMLPLPFAVYAVPASWRMLVLERYCPGTRAYNGYHA